MKRSLERMLCTHVGRLQRPDDITASMETDPRGRPTDCPVRGAARSAVAEVVKQQADAGSMWCVTASSES